MSTTWLQVANNASTTLAADLTALATSMNLASIDDMPTQYPFRLTIWNAGLYGYRNPGDDPNMEIVEVTGVTSGYAGDYDDAGPEYEISRAQEGTVAVAHQEGDVVALLVTAGLLQQIQDAISALEGA